MKRFARLIFVIVTILAVPSPVAARTSSGKCIYNYCNEYCNGDSVYCRKHDSSYRHSHKKCCQAGCTSYIEPGCGSYCKTHYDQKFGKNTYSSQKKYSSSSTREKSKYLDPYDVYEFDDADDFADEWEEEFEDWDDAWDYFEEYH